MLYYRRKLCQNQEKISAKEKTEDGRLGKSRVTMKTEKPFLAMFMGGAIKRHGKKSIRRFRLFVKKKKHYPVPTIYLIVY